MRTFFYKNNKEYVFPKVYREITEKYERLLVMENISGLKFKDIETMKLEKIEKKQKNEVFLSQHFFC